MYGWTAAFWSIIAARWTVQLVATRGRALDAPRDVLTGLLLVLYVGLGTTAAVLGSVGLLEVAIVSLSLMLRIAALASVGRQFGNSVGPSAESRLVTTGAYGLIRNPLVAAYWLELLAFTTCLPWNPVTHVSVAMLLAVVCAWHAREDNRLLAAANSEYSEYAASVLDGPLALFLPSRAVALNLSAWRVETFGVYAAAGALVGQWVAIGYGARPIAFAVALPSGLVGAMVYWRLTRRTTKRRIGFSFFGGLLAGTSAFLAVSAAAGGLTPASLAASVMGLAVGHAIGRMGCVAHGCCTGSVIAEARAYAVTYSDPEQRINLVRGVRTSTCTPAVIIELIGQLGIAAACGAWPTHSVPIWCIGYGALRTIIQSMRVESGEVTRVLPAVALIAVGCLSIQVPWATLTMTWTAPTLPDRMLATGIAVSLGAAFGLRPVRPVRRDALAAPIGMTR